MKSRRSTEQQDFLTLFSEYEAELAKSNLLDYDDLLLRCRDLLLQHPQCVSNVEAVLIDEFQDTSIVQFELMKLFASARQRITIVGDPDQSIYGWRAAEIKNLLRMQQHYMDTSVINLEENYRSCGAILSSAQDVIEQDLSRPNKKLKATHSFGALPTFRKLPSASAEASWIVLEIQRAIALTGRMLNFSDFSILLRSAYHSRLIETAMGKAGIPYVMVGGTRFFDRKEIRILVDYLRTISQPRNNDAFLAIINVPARGIGELTIKGLLEEADQKKLPLFTFVKDVVQGNRKFSTKITKPALANLSTLVGLVLKARDKLSTCEPKTAPKVLLDFIVKQLSFKDYLERHFPEEEENRWTNVSELLAQAEGMDDLSTAKDSEELPVIEEIEQQTVDGSEEVLSRFLANIVLSSDVQSDDDGEKEKVTLSTIHAAKGLEWPVVFIPGVYEGSIPNSRAEDTDEERRLLYVAMTRAEALLYLIQPLRQPRENAETTISSFITPKALAHYFQDSGPTFNDSLNKSISKTLRRSVPSVSVIMEEMMKLRSISDDLWPLSGEYGDEDRKLWNQVEAETSYTPCTTASSDGYVTSLSAESTMSQATSFSCSTIEQVSSGFQSATHHLQATIANENTMQSSSNALAKKLTEKKRPMNKVPPKGNITSFFRRPGKDAIKQVSTSTISEATVPKRMAPDAVHSNASQYQVQQRVKLAIPENMLRHRLPAGPTVGFKRPRPLADTETNTRYKRLDLHSSSPPPEATEEEPENVATLPNKFVTVNGFQPASIMQSTSTTMSTTMTSMMQRDQPMGTGVPRKTYGIRRSMNGWADRMNRG